MPTRVPTRVGRIILLRGASSAGESTLARAVQRALDEPFLYVASDHLPVGLPERRPFPWWGHGRPRFFDGFQRCIAALAAAGNDLIVDYVIAFPTRSRAGTRVGATVRPRRSARTAAATRRTRGSTRTR